MEITSAVEKRKETLALGAPTIKPERARNVDTRIAFSKLKKASSGKHAMS